MSGSTTAIEVKNFDAPDEARPFESHGEVRLVTVADKEIGLGRFEPGWSWREDVKPISAKIDEELFPVVEDLGQDKSGDPGRKALHSAVQRFWSGTRTKTFPSEAALTTMRKELESARAAIEQQTGLKLPAPRVVPADHSSEPRP